MTEDSPSRMPGYGPFPEGAEPTAPIPARPIGVEQQAYPAPAPHDVAPADPASGQTPPENGAKVDQAGSDPSQNADVPPSAQNGETLPAGAQAGPDQSAGRQPSYGQPYGQAAGTQPSSATTAFGQPSGAQPSSAQPAYNQPAYNQPSSAQPAYGQPISSQPDPGQPAAAGYPGHLQAGNRDAAPPNAAPPNAAPPNAAPPNAAPPNAAPPGSSPGSDPYQADPVRPTSDPAAYPPQPTTPYPVPPTGMDPHATNPVGGLPSATPTSGTPTSAAPASGSPYLTPASGSPYPGPSSGSPYPTSGTPSYGPFRNDNPPDQYDFTSFSGRRIEPSPPPQRSRLLKGLLAGLVAGLLVFGIGGFFTGRLTASDAAPKPKGAPTPGKLGVFEQSQAALNQPHFAGTGLVAISQSWLPYLSSCSRSGEPGGPAVNAGGNTGEKARVRCTLSGMSAIFVEYSSIADRDKARVKTLAQNVDARTLTPGVGPAVQRATPSGRTNGNYVEYAYKLTEGGVTRPVAALWWDDSQTPVAGYLLAYWKEGLGESWDPIRDLWSRYA